jgi:hypothetical protein
MQPSRIHDVLSQGGASARDKRYKLVGKLVSTKRLMIKKAHRDARLHVRLKESVQLSHVPTDTAMGVRLKSWVEGAQIETNGYHAP